MTSTAEPVLKGIHAKMSFISISYLFSGF